MEEKPLAPEASLTRPFPAGPGGIELTYDPEGREVGPGQKGANLALIGEGPHSRVYRGRSGVGDVAIKIQKEDSPNANAVTEGRWSREFEALGRYGGEEPGLLAVEPIPGFGDAEEPPSFEPLILCREMGLLFSLPCPRCMRVHVLADCRDDAALASAGLPPWSTSRDRFLWCSACGREDPAFYTRTKRYSSPKLNDFVALVRGLRLVVDRGQNTDPVASELLAGLERDFPCMTCEHRATCYPRPDDEAQGMAEVRLTPVSLNEFHAWPLPLCRLGFDEAADLLSGAPVADLVRRYARSWKTPALRRMKEEALSHGSPPDALQALAGKLDLYAQAVQCVHRLHAMSHMPHLGISPQHLLVDPGDGGTPLVRLASPAAARILKDIRMPPPAPLAPYAAPAMRDDRFGREYSVRIHVGKVWSADSGTFFAGVLKGEGLPVADIAEKDEICLHLKDEDWKDLRIWCRPLSGAQARPEPGALGVVTEPEDLDRTQKNDLEAAKNKAPLFGTVTIHRDFGIPYDVHALGMVLFRTFFVNGVQSFERVVEEFVMPLASSVELFRKNRPDSDLETLREAIRGFLGDDTLGRMGGPANVWHEPATADASRIPEEAWLDLLLVGLRAVTFIPGFSYLDSDREKPDAEAGAATLEMLSELDRIGEIVSGALLSAAPAAHADDDSIMSAQPLTDDDLQEITGEVRRRLESELTALKSELERAEAERRGLVSAWNQLYKSVVGKADSDAPPSASDDGRISLLTATVEESIECITQVFKGIARLAGDELGENVPKIRVLIQDALFESEGGKVDAAGKVKKIRRQLKALRMFLFAVVQTFLEANSQSTKEGTKSLLGQMETMLFAPVVKGRKEREPDFAEIRRRFDELKQTVPENHHRVFQPFFQSYVRQKLAKLQ